MIHNVDVLQDNYTLLEQQKSVYVWIVLLSVWFFALFCSKTSSWCRPMFWLVSLAVVCNEVSHTFGDTGSHTYYVLESLCRLSIAVFGVGIAYSFCRKYWNMLSDSHIHSILSIITLLSSLLFIMEGTALVQRFTTNACDWFTPMHIWYLIIISLSLICIRVVIQIPRRLVWLKTWMHPMSMGLVVFGWIYYYVHQQYCARPFESSQNFSSLFLLIVYIIWDRNNCTRQTNCKICVS